MTFWLQNYFALLTNLDTFITKYLPELTCSLQNPIDYDKEYSHRRRYRWQPYQLCCCRPYQWKSTKVDVDEDGLPELWALRLTALLLCTENPWNATAYAVYAPNLAELEAEAPGVQGYREVLAALLGMSQDLQDYFVSRLGLTGDYVVFQDPGKTPNEPLSGQGDLDRDGLSNAQEYAAVVASGGSIEDFAQMALFWQGAGAMPVAGLLGIIALGGACAAMAVRRIKRSQ